MPSFDLTTDPWIPVRHTHGGPAAPVGLKTLLHRAHEYTDVELALPPASAGLWRILALIAARLTGLDTWTDWSDWAQARTEILREGRFDPGEIEAYFHRHHDRFDLFGRRPWLQDPRLSGPEAQCPKTSGVNKLCWGRPAGNTQVWLRHTTDLRPIPVPAAEAAHHLIATLYYGPSGRCTSRTAGDVSAADTAAGPLRGALSFHPLGRTLFESLLLNLPFVEDDEDTPAPWEREELRDPTLPPPVAGLAGRLVNQFRHAVLLEPSPDATQVVDATVTWGARLSPEIRQKWAAPEDPYQVHIHRDDGTIASMKADATRAVWRDLAAILNDGQHRGRLTRMPRLHHDLRYRLPSDISDAMRARAFGFDQDGQTRDKQWFTATTPPVLRWLHESADDAQQAGRTLRAIRQATDAAEDAGWRLERQLTRAWKDSGLGGDVKREDSAPWTLLGTGRYWSRAHDRFWQLVGGDDPQEPGNAFIDLALHAYAEATDGYRHRPRVAKAVARNRGALFKNRIDTPDEGEEGAA
ncbi:type I-E CRISPR-associated protein Cse1/CasA [Streptomonospora salina]|uniref:CRISPR system Cascade subunit CasA n=1 Tax=Streptomonospora salina TaxID=104205 RepID=A0A841EAA3_9ACTN|nr:type I-E CRISPR-associated protein Cse1/CasA [Streptomonospora salina]MBB6000055.1 CRISPR system Cascade subunit CasA [Streptomonospora salina]